MARWTDLAKWVGPSPNTGDGDQYPNEGSDRMREVRGLVVHTASGYYLGTIAWQRNANANVSSHFILAGPRDVPKGVADGTLAQMVDTDITAWTQREGNGHWLSVECSGFGGTNDGQSGDKLSVAQMEQVARLLVKAHLAYGVPLQLASGPDGYGLGWHSMGAENGANWGHEFCPGEPIKAQLPAVVARAVEIANGLEDDMALFVTKDEKGALWVNDGMERRPLPADGLQGFVNRFGRVIVNDRDPKGPAGLTIPDVGIDDAFGVLQPSGGSGGGVSAEDRKSVV